MSNERDTPRWAECDRSAQCRLTEICEFGKCRPQCITDRQCAGLPDLIDGAEGVMVCSIRETRFEAIEATADWVLAGAEITVEIMAPCSFRYE